jgi:hypothetical protein
MQVLDVKCINESLGIDAPDFLYFEETSFVEKQWTSPWFKGKPWNKGISHTKETKKKISEALKGRIPYNKGIPHTEETKRKISIANFGKTSYWKEKTIPKSSVEKMKATKKLKGSYVGECNPMAKTYRITFDNENFIMIKSLQTWAIENGYKPTSLRNLYNGRQKSPHKNVISVSVEFM